MNYCNDDFKLFLAEHRVFDAWQFLANTNNNILIAEYCSKIIEKSIEKIILEHDNFQTKLNNQIQCTIKEGGGSISMGIDDIPQNTVTILEMEVSLYFIIEKYLKDFFQYIRNSFDIVGQFLNAALLANVGLNIDIVDFQSIYNEFKKYKDIFPKIFKAVENTKHNEIYKYISAFNNRVKHTYDVQNIISLSIFDDKKKIVISEFQKYGKVYPEEDMLNKINEVLVFTQKAIDNIIDSSYSEIKLYRFNKNRIHDVYYYVQDMKNVSSNFTTIHIEVGNDTLELPSEIGVLLLKEKENEIEAINCDYEDILIKNSSGKYIGRFITEDKIEKDGLIKYRKYKLDNKVDCNTAFIEHINKKYGFKPLVMDGKIVTDKYNN